LIFLFVFQTKSKHVKVNKPGLQDTFAVMTNKVVRSKDDNQVTAKSNTDLAVTRTVMAADRSLMAWIRTGLSLISFGFTIYKFLDYSREQFLGSGVISHSVSSPKLIGLFLIGLGVISLLMGTIENEATIRQLRKNHVFTRPRYSLYMSIILMVFGILLFLGVVLRISVLE
jgi:putative membrane protein